MYGLVNRAVHQMVTSHFDEATWERVRTRAGVGPEPFASMQAYDDDVTFRLVGAASDELGIEPDAVLEAFGEYWTVFTATEGYGSIMKLAGDNLPEFLANLDEMHARVGMSFPELRPPSFRCTQLSDSQLKLEYRSERDGLTALVVGLLRGLGTRFGTPVEVEIVERKSEGNSCDEFLVTWEQTT